jgi:hypothetical protein
MKRQNLDVAGTSRDQESAETKSSAGELAPDPHLSGPNQLEAALARVFGRLIVSQPVSPDPIQASPH